MTVGAYFSDVAPIPIAEFRARLSALYQFPMRSKAQCSTMDRVFRRLTEIGGVETTADLTTATVARFIKAQQDRGLHPNTVHSLVSVLRAACNIAAMEGLVRVSPFAVRKRWVRPVTPRPPRIHSREEISRVLAKGLELVRSKKGWARWRAHRTYALAATVAYTGMRRNEALTLRREDVDVQARMILITSRVGSMLKTAAAAQPVPIPIALSEILASWLERLDATPIPARHPGRNGDAREPIADDQLIWNTPDGRPPEGAAPPPTGWLGEGMRARGWKDDGKPKPPRPPAEDLPSDPGWVFPNAYRTSWWQGGPVGNRPLDRLKKLGERAGVPGFTFQSLRHSWATHAEYWGLSDAQIQRILRHTNSRTQWHYRHAEAENMRRMSDGIDFGPAKGADGDPEP